MSKIRNSIYGLALGDSKGYPTECLGWADTVSTYKSMENNGFTHPELLVSDDTQMSIALIQGIEDCIREVQSQREKIESKEEIIANSKFQEFLNHIIQSLTFKDKVRHPDPEVQQLVISTNMNEMIMSVGRRFVEWSRSPENSRAPGIATMQALSSLAGGKSMDINRWINTGTRINSNSKGSGTIMRSPWISFLVPSGTVQESNLRDFCHLQSRITHGHPTALEASYLTADINLAAYRGEIEASNVLEYALHRVSKMEQNHGTLELDNALFKARSYQRRYKAKSKYDEDPAYEIGANGCAENVLATALMLISSFPDDPNEVIDRSAVSTGDTDTIGAVAGGIHGTFFTEKIWDESLIEESYIQRLDDVTNFLENINK